MTSPWQYMHECIWIHQWLHEDHLVCYGFALFWLDKNKLDLIKLYLGKKEALNNYTKQT